MKSSIFYLNIIKQTLWTGRQGHPTPSLTPTSPPTTPTSTHNHTITTWRLAAANLVSTSASLRGRSTNPSFNLWQTNTWKNIFKEMHMHGILNFTDKPADQHTDNVYYRVASPRLQKSWPVFSLEDTRIVSFSSINHISFFFCFFFVGEEIHFNYE